MAAFISRLRRRVDEGRLTENYTSIELQDSVSEILVDDNCVTTNDDFSEPASETGSVNTYNTVVAGTENNNYSLACVESINRTGGDFGDAATIVERTKTKRLAVAGIALTIISSLLLSITALLIKLAESIPSIEVVSMRSILQLVFSIPPLIFFKDKLVHP